MCGVVTYKRLLPSTFIHTFNSTPLHWYKLTVTKTCNLEKPNTPDLKRMLQTQSSVQSPFDKYNNLILDSKTTKQNFTWMETELHNYIRNSVKCKHKQLQCYILWEGKKRNQDYVKMWNDTYRAYGPNNIRRCDTSISNCNFIKTGIL
jgi:hypothetical protein